MLAEHGEERTTEVGETLFAVGDRRYPFIAIREGEAAVQDPAGHEIVRHGASGFLGEMNLLSGQTVFLTAVVTQPMRYIAVDRDVLRPLLFEDERLADLLLSTFISRREALYRRRGGRRGAARDERSRRLRRGRRALRLGQALRHRGGRGRDGRALRTRAAVGRARLRKVGGGAGGPRTGEGPGVA